MSRKKKDKNMRLPSGYGSVSKMSNAERRRKPFAVRIPMEPVLNPETGKVTRKNKIIGYSATKEEGYQMLAKYHEHPFNLDFGDITFREMYDLVYDDNICHLSRSSINGYRAAYNTCTKLYERKFRDLKTYDLQDIIDNCNKGYESIKKIKVLYSKMYDYAMKNDICYKDYSDYVDIEKFNNEDKSEKIVIEKEILDVIWSLSDNKYNQIILFLVYTGVRIGEMFDLKKKHVHLDKQYFDIVNAKTDNGIRRVPISDYILPFVKAWYEDPRSEYLFHPDKSKQFTYHNYCDSYFNPIMNQLNPDVTPHCTRHTFISELADNEVSQTFTKLIVGHAGAMSVTEKVYTHIPIETFIRIVNTKLYYPDWVLKQYKKD